MTWIVDDNGRRWVDNVPRKKRKPARAIRFELIKLGDQVMQTNVAKGYHAGHTYAEHKDNPIEISRTVMYYLVTDLWFDPVAGQYDEISGQMVAIRLIDARGNLIGRKWPHTKRGLASQGFHYADRDFIKFCQDRSAAYAEKKVIGIGYGNIVRQRPKTPGRNL